MWAKSKEARIMLVHSSEGNQGYDVPSEEEARPGWLSGACVLVLLLLGNVIVFSLAAYGLYDLVRN